MSDNMRLAKGPTDKPLISATLGDLLDDVVAKYNNKSFIISKHQNLSVTYGEAIAEAENLALGLHQIGHKNGDKIGIIAKNSLEAFVTNLACIRGGFVAANLNPASQQRELEYCINKVKLECIICVDKYRNYNMLDILKKIVPEIEHSENGIIKSKLVPSLESVVVISDIIYKGTYNFEDVKVIGKQVSKELIKNIQINVGSKDLCMILFTSGTTGNPKAVGLTHYQMYNFANLLTVSLGLDKKEYKFCFYLPLFHLFGQMFILFSLKSRGPLVLPSYYYNGEENLKTITDEGCTFLMGSPSMFADLIKLQKEKQLPLVVEQAVTGSSLCPDIVLREIKEVLNIKSTIILYGSTECLLVSFNWIKNDEEQTSTLIGNITDHLEVKVIDNKGNTVPLGTVGNLCVRGYAVIRKYLGEDNNSKDFDEGGYFKTGDAIFLDKDKRAHISGRLKDIINRVGEKLSPAEVEEILEKHPKVLEAGVSIS